MYILDLWMKSVFHSFLSLQVVECTDGDYAILAKTKTKFPGGTPGKWERIAQELGRQIDEVSCVNVRSVSRGPAMI